MQAIDHEERLRRWRLILGGDKADGIGCQLCQGDLVMDRALQALYDPDAPGGLGRGSGGGRGGSGGSAPSVARWLGDIRKYFPSSVVQVMQKDALERLDMHKMLLEPEMLEAHVRAVELVHKAGADEHVRVYRPRRARNQLADLGSLPDDLADERHRVVVHVHPADG